SGWQTVLMLAGAAGATLVLSLGWRQWAALDCVCPDILCYWSAGQALVHGQDLYDPTVQASYQTPYLRAGEHGETAGILSAFVYPHWLGFLCVPFAALDFTGAKAVWLAVSVQLLLIIAFWLRPATGPRWLPFVVVPFFLFSWTAALIGQVVLVVLFMLTAAWRLLDDRRDLAGGALLAWLTIKPHLALLLLPAVALWALRHGRPRILIGMMGAGALLVLASFIVQPTWPADWLGALKRFEMPTERTPGIGATWMLVLRARQLPPEVRWPLYLAVAVPVAVLLVWRAWDRSSGLAEVLSLGVLAAFFVGPYSQPYDYCLLVVPLFLLLGNQQASVWGAVVIGIFLIGPYIHASYFLSGLEDKYTLFWLPVLVLAVWFGTRGARRAESFVAGSEC
ncbi:MAG: DUF2029 domain-containing protein, partial [Planctomycetia bacterium]|nr:DUF2029 domain-containing protein [Planctomycetia bacterium]